MTVADMINELKKLDPTLPVINIMGDCDEVYEGGDPELGFVNDAESPSAWSATETEHCKVKAVRL